MATYSKQNQLVRCLKVSSVWNTTEQATNMARLPVATPGGEAETASYVALVSMVFPVLSHPDQAISLVFQGRFMFSS